MQDYIIDTDVTIRFSVQYGGRTILDEDYVPDGNNQVRWVNFVPWPYGACGLTANTPCRLRQRVPSFS